MGACKVGKAAVLVLWRSSCLLLGRLKSQRYVKFSLKKHKFEVSSTSLWTWRTGFNFYNFEFIKGCVAQMNHKVDVR